MTEYTHTQADGRGIKRGGKAKPPHLHRRGPRGPGAAAEEGVRVGQLMGWMSRLMLPNLLGRGKRSWQKTEREGRPYTRRQARPGATNAARKNRTLRPREGGPEKPNPKLVLEPVGLKRKRKTPGSRRAPWRRRKRTDNPGQSQGGRRPTKTKKQKKQKTKSQQSQQRTQNPETKTKQKNPTKHGQPRTRNANN